MTATISKDAAAQASRFNERNDSSKLLANELAASHGQLKLNMQQHAEELDARETDPSVLQSGAKVDRIFENAKLCGRKRTEQIRSCSPP